MFRLNLTRATALLAAALAATLLARVPALAADSSTDLDRSMLDYSFLRAGAEFYRAVDDQTLLDGAVSGIKDVVRSKGGDPAKVPALHGLGTRSADISLLNQELVNVDRDYGKTVGDRMIAYGAIAGMLKSLNDRWTVFMTPDEYKALNQDLDGGGFPGIGVVMDTDAATKSPIIVQVVEGGPAQRAGLQVGDIILLIDGHATAGLSMQQQSSMIRGKPGTTVSLQVQRRGEQAPRAFSIVREFIHQPSVLTRTLDNNIGYVRVLVFGGSTGEEVSNALHAFERAGVKAYIVDLRYNGGGYLNAAVDVASKFVADGPIVSIDSRQKPLTTINAESGAVEARPLAVLVNGSTASASEIAAGAVQDSGAGILIGTKTYGKGEVQTVYPLPDGSAIKITTARYLTPSGRDINTIGIKPDIEIGPDVKVTDIGNLTADAQLQRALSYIHDAIVNGLVPTQGANAQPGGTASGTTNAPNAANPPAPSGSSGSKPGGK
jgi:carboxyl-terminal processing protease